MFSLSSLCHAAGRSRDEGEQMLREGRGGDAGVHADHHVLDPTPNSYPPPCSTWLNKAALLAQCCTLPSPLQTWPPPPLPLFFDDLEQVCPL